MERIQIFLNAAERCLLDAESARTGCSVSAVIRDAIVTTYDHRRDVPDDLAVITASAGSWTDRGIDGADWVDSMRSGGRLERR